MPRYRLAARWLLGLLPFVLLWPTVSLAAPRLLVVTAGNCESLDLEGNGRALDDALRAIPGQQIVASETLEELTFPRPSKSVEDLRRQLTVAENHFYDGRPDTAISVLLNAFHDISRLPPGETRWELFRKAQLLASLSFFAQQRVQEAEDALREVLHLDPGYRLEPHDYSERLRRQFEVVRRSVANGPRVSLAVRSTLPNSEIFVNGRPQGPAPATLKLPPGRYHVQLRRGQSLSFPRWVELRGSEVGVLADMDFESSLRTDPFPCIQASELDDKAQHHALKVGAWVDASDVVVFRVEKEGDGPRWLAAATFNVERGQKIREAGFKSLNVRASQNSIEALARYIATGQARPEIVVVDQAVRPPWRPAAPVATAGTYASDPRRDMRVASYSLVGVGAAVLAGGAVARVLAQNDVNALQTRLRSDGSIDPNDATAVGLVSSARTKNALFITGMAVGGAAVVASGVLMYLSYTTRSPIPVAIVPAPGGAMIATSGRF